MHPFNIMFHRTSLTSAIAEGTVPTFLLNSIFALAAPFCSHPSLRPPRSQQSMANNPPWHAGERFAHAAIAELVDPATDGVIRGAAVAAAHKGYELEVAQALCCLQMHETVVRRPGHEQNLYMEEALSVLMSLSLPELQEEHPASTEDHAANEQAAAANAKAQRALWRRRECHRRTLWIVHFYNLLASAFTQTAIRFREPDVKLCLPVDEGVFELVMTNECSPGVLPVGNHLRSG